MKLSDVYDGDYVLIQEVELDKGSVYIGLNRLEQKQLYEFLKPKFESVKTPALSERSIRNKLLGELIEHYEQVIENGKGVTYNHPITYRWMYQGMVVDYLKKLRDQESEK